MTKRRHHPTPRASPATRRQGPGILTGRPTVSGVIGLVVVVLAIGVAGGYLAARLAGPTGAGSGGGGRDPGAVWRARLLRDPQDVEALLGLAHVHLDAQRLDDAEPLYRQVLSLQPTNVEAIAHLGTVVLGRGQPEAALREYDRALSIQPDYIHALWDKAHLLQQVMRDYPAAIRTWEAFLRAVGPDSPDGKSAQRFMAEARDAMGKSSPADRALDKRS
jgi:Tfp pilus assembly protein PilF